MRVKVEFYADLREKVGFASKEIVFEGSTVLDLIVYLDAITGGRLAGYVLEGGRLKEFVKVLVKGRDIRGINGLQTELSEGDEVSFFPPIAGG